MDFFGAERNLDKLLCPPRASRYELAHRRSSEHLRLMIGVLDRVPKPEEGKYFDCSFEPEEGKHLIVPLNQRKGSI